MHIHNPMFRKYIYLWGDEPAVYPLKPDTYGPGENEIY